LRTIAAVGAVDGSAANVGCALPNDLGEVAIPVEGSVVVDVGRCGLAIEASEVAHLVVVEQLGDHRGNVVSGAAGGDVLAVSSATSGSVVFVAASVANLRGNGGKVVVPLESWRRVVGAVSIMVSNDQFRVRFGSGGDGSGWSGSSAG